MFFGYGERYMPLPGNTTNGMVEYCLALREKPGSGYSLQAYGLSMPTAWAGKATSFGPEFSGGLPFCWAMRAKGEPNLALTNVR